MMENMKVREIRNLRAEQLIEVLDLFGIGKEAKATEEKFIAESKVSAKVNRAFDARYTVTENCHGEGWNIMDNEGTDCFYNVMISPTELDALATMPGAKVEEI